MDLTPNDIRNQKFSTSFRGYTRDEVDAFMDSVASALEETRVQAMKLGEEKETLERRYQDLRNLEETIKAAVIEAQKGAENILANARKEAELIVAESRRQRDLTIEEKHRKLAEMEMRMEELEFTRKTLFTRLRADIGVTLKLLEAMNPVPDDKKDSKPISKHESPDTEIDKIVEQFRKESGAIPFEGSVREESVKRPNAAIDAKENKDEL